MDYRRLFADVAERPGAYGLDGSFAQFAVFVNGCDAGNDWGLLVGFTDWLAIRAGTGANLVWESQIRHLARVAADGGPVADAALAQELFARLDEFLVMRAEPGVPASIFRDYEEWRRRERPG